MKIPYIYIFIIYIVYYILNMYIDCLIPPKNGSCFYDLPLTFTPQNAKTAPKTQAFPVPVPFGHHYATCRSLARKIVERPLCLTWGNTSRVVETLGTCLGKNMIRLLGSMPWTLPRGPPTFLEEEVFYGK